MNLFSIHFHAQNIYLQIRLELLHLCLGKIIQSAGVYKFTVLEAKTINY